MNKVVRNLLIAGIIISIVGIIYVVCGMASARYNIQPVYDYGYDYQIHEDRTYVRCYAVDCRTDLMPWMDSFNMLSDGYEPSSYYSSHDVDDIFTGYKFKILAWNALPLLLIGIGCAVGLIVCGTRKNKQVPPYRYGYPPQR